MYNTSCIICTDMIDYDTADSLQYIHCLQWLLSMCADDSIKELSLAIFVITNYYY